MSHPLSDSLRTGSQLGWDVKGNRGAKLARRGLGEKNRSVWGRGGEGGAVDFVLMPPIGLLAIYYPVTHMSVTCQSGYETDQIHFLHLNASASITFACT